jgi:YD repeat-containing protein
MDVVTPNKTYETVSADPHRDTELAIAKNEKALKHIHAAHWDHAEKALQEALVADVMYGPAHNNLGWVYYKQGRYYVAAWEFEYAQKLMVGIPEPVNNLGLVYEVVGRLPEAQACFDEAAGADPHNPQFLANLARVRLKQGERSTDTAHILRGVAFHDERPEWPSGTYIGLTTTYAYDDDLNDSTGLDSIFSNYLTGLNLGDDSDGSGMVVVSPDTNRTLRINDGRRRPVRHVALTQAGSSLVQLTHTYDALASFSGYGDVVETTTTTLSGSSERERHDGAGRLTSKLDADSMATTFKYNANGDLLSVQDANGILHTSAYDALGREASLLDAGTHSLARSSFIKVSNA